MASFTIKKGKDLRFDGTPEPVVQDAPTPEVVSVYPTEYTGIKFRLLVKEGDSVKRGTPLIFNKKNEAFKVVAPAAGTVQAIVYGKRRVLERIEIKSNGSADAETFPSYTADSVCSASRDDLFNLLENTGYSALIKARPFSRPATPDQKPKSIFVNGMNTAPFSPDANVLIQGNETVFQIGLNALARLTEGKVHLCLDGAKSNHAALTGAKNVDVHTFTGPHPSGNTSVHIHHIDPISPNDVVWTAKVADVILIGQLLATGQIPPTRIVLVAGSGQAEGERKYFRIAHGAPLASILRKNPKHEAVRTISGDLLSGPIISETGAIQQLQHAYTLLHEDSTRHFLGWLAPGLNRFSLSRSYLSGWLKQKSIITSGTNQNGELRAMVITGLYDRYMPMNIMTDFLIRAILARDADEMIALGLLETDPEDFALCAFACPSKMDLCGIVRKGLDQIEREGI
ncbi:MAG TPA: Na(+)-translocating NADH-quinone reductase subunit A [Kiritimatiellia bacterium]|nr:Na(+)-translocating NADH-quinone reductase subunit A [Kiritimatiellia bacterium]